MRGSIGDLIDGLGLQRGDTHAHVHVRHFTALMNRTILYEAVVRDMSVFASHSSICQPVSANIVPMLGATKLARDETAILESPSRNSSRIGPI